MSTTIKSGRTHRLELLVTDVNGSGVTGLLIDYVIRKSSDYSIVESGSLTEFNSGIYYTDIVLNELGQYLIHYQTPFSYEDSIESINVVGSMFDDLMTTLRKVLGFGIYTPEC